MQRLSKMFNEFDRERQWQDFTVFVSVWYVQISPWIVLEYKDIYKNGKYLILTLHEKNTYAL